MQDEDSVSFSYTTICHSRILHLVPERGTAYLTQRHTDFLIGDTPSLVLDMKVCG